MIAIDHATLVDDHIIVQYVDSPQFIAWIKAIVADADELEAVFDELFSSRDYTLGTTSGVNLDVIGRIVGQSRSVATAGQLFFGFAGHIQAGTYGDVNDASVGERYRTLSEDTDGSRLLLDAEYRNFIKAKINRNHSTPTIESIINITLQYFGESTGVEIEDASDHGQGSMEAIITINRGLTQEEKALLTLAEALPRPAGVLYWLYDKPFGGAKILLGTSPATQPDLPVISEQPIDVSVTAPAAAVFSSNATNYTWVQWQSKAPGEDAWYNIPGALSVSITIDPTDITQSLTYIRVTYSNGFWQKISDEVLLTVT